MSPVTEWASTLRHSLAGTNMMLARVVERVTGTQVPWREMGLVLLLCIVMPCLLPLARRWRARHSQDLGRRRWSASTTARERLSKGGRPGSGSGSGSEGPTMEGSRLQVRGDAGMPDLMIVSAPPLDATDTDPALLRKHSTLRSYSTPIHGFTYPGIRVFYRPHPHADKLPSDPPLLPLIVVIHGLGGSLAQFHPLLKSLVHLAPCLGLDLPGCGTSRFAPRAWAAYTAAALVELIATVIEDHRDAPAGQGVVLIGHSMGCALSALLASPTSPYPFRLAAHVRGLVAICPRVRDASPHEARIARRLLMVPGPLFDLWRRWDRRGGVASASVRRFVSTGADPETQALQLRFNAQSRTAVWRRMLAGFLQPAVGAATAWDRPRLAEVWAGLAMPILLVGGEDDVVTSPDEIRAIVRVLGEDAAVIAAGHAALHAAHADRRPPAAAAPSNPTSPARPGSGRVVRAIILPPPAGHSLLYAPVTSRALAGLISDFLGRDVCGRLSLGWQLHYLSTEGKWDVKNLAKWQAVGPVSEPIGGVFRAMKTLREVDEAHSPAVFGRRWAGRITDVVDISHESPVYDPRGLETAGIAYHKFPTVSKFPPTPDEVRHFIALIDRLRPGPVDAGDEAEAEAEAEAEVEMVLGRPAIGVHCHYGFNRTGFFVVCYLVERQGYALPAALEEFARRRPPGIRHEHFINTLFVRYYL
ncbi:MAG: hypothetical protein M1826_004913 [Phylliscum demangeonii]|nr:MAG: hypothetical protein M1826_004913 [Phylliscum demangeonii]